MTSTKPFCRCFEHVLRLERGACISKDGVYRYLLWRRWSQEPMLPIVMLNPSTADGLVDDPTITRCAHIAKNWQHGGILVINVFGYRATDPSALLPLDYMTRWGSDNLLHGCEMLQRFVTPDTSPRVLCAWGAFMDQHAARMQHHVPFLRSMFQSVPYGSYVSERLVCIGTTKAGAPRHPLYSPDTEPIPWRFPCE